MGIRHERYCVPATVGAFAGPNDVGHAVSVFDRWGYRIWLTARIVRWALADTPVARLMSAFEGEADQVRSRLMMGPTTGEGSAVT